MIHHATQHVLIVEDDANQRRLLARQLGDHYALTFADSFDEGLAQAQGGTFDMLLLDINLGGRRNGIDLLKRLRQMAAYRHTPALAFTAHRELALHVSFLEQGFDGYLLKPASKRQLLGALEALAPQPTAPGAPAPPEHPMRTMWRELAAAWHHRQQIPQHVYAFR